MSGNLRSQNLSIMMTDIQGYTDASSGSSREEIINLIRRHNQLMVPVITFYGGRIIKSIGDAFLCTFQSATDAVVCSIIIQLLLKEYNDKQADKAKKMNLRVVINTGDVTLEKSDIYGDAVNVTARMEGLSCFPGGTIGISESTYLLMNRNEIAAEKIGPQTLKGIPEPVTVYKIPLEKQKITSIPPKLSQIVERTVNEKNPSGGGELISSEQINEWSSALGGFLKEKKWGENISAFMDDNKIKESIAGIQGQLSKTFTKENISKTLTKEGVANVQKQITQTFSQKTVIESKSAGDFNEAPIVSRVKSFIIDAVIIAFAWLIVSCALWWPVQSMVWGKEFITQDEFNEMNMNIKNYKESFANFNNYKKKFVNGNLRYYRPMGYIEWFVSFNMDYPFIPLILYFGLFWMIKGASPGQIASKTAVVMENDEKLDLVVAFKRAAIFVFSNTILGAGSLMLLTGEKRTLYDKLCETKVIE